MNIYDKYIIATDKGVLTSQETLFHDSANPPQADGKQCFKLWGYHDPISWLTDEQKEEWTRIDKVLQGIGGE